MKWIRLALVPAAIFILLALSLIVLSAPVEAYMLPFTLTTLATGADAIIVGRVDSRQSAWNAGRTAINTQILIAIEESIKGDLGPHYAAITVPGGTADGITETVSDMPEFAPGERMVLFLKYREADDLTVYGQEQGKFTIFNDRVGEEPINDFIAKVKSAISGTRAPGGVTFEEAGPISLPGGGIPILPPAPPAQTRAGEWTTVTSLGFETGQGAGWYVSGDPTWGSSAYTLYSGSYSGYCAGAGTNAVNPAVSNYPNTMNSWLYYGPFGLTDASSANITFAKWLKSETNADHLWVVVSTQENTGYWGYRYSGLQDAWSNVSLDLRDWPYYGNLCEQSQIYIAFIFITDGNAVTDKGAFLDNIVLNKYNGPAPRVTAISPPSESAGTNREIFIAGTGFGATTGSVSFHYQKNQPRMPATVLSWSDNSIRTTVPIGPINGYSASASSGPVCVRDAAGIDGYYYPFNVTFSYGTRKWDSTSPVVNFLINENCNDPGATTQRAAVEAAAATWSAVPGKTFSVTCTGGTGSTSPSYNNFNEVMWVNLGSTGPLAQATTWSLDGIILEADIQFNEYFTWSTAATPPTSTYDVQSIALHELGHWLNLRDLYGEYPGYPQDADKVMFGIADIAFAKRTLTAADISGIQWIYPPTSVPPSVATLNATAVTQNSATLNGNLTSLGTASSVNVSFEWGTTTAYGNITSVQVMNATGEFNATLSGLAANTTYHFRAVASGNGIAYGNDSTFATLPVYTLTIATNGNGTTTPPVGNHTYPAGTVVNLTATPDPGWEFASWTGNVADANSTITTILMDTDETVTANFSQIVYTLRISVNGNGTTTLPVGNHTYTAGTVVNLTATPDVGWAFDTWNGDASGTANPVSVTMDSDKSVTAVFVQLPPDAPSNLTATAVSPTEINLAWQDNAFDETGFRIERKTDINGTYSELAAVGADVLGYSDSGLTAGITSYYRVYAYNAAGNSTYSNEANATTLTIPPVIVTLRATVVDRNSLMLAGNLTGMGTASTVQVSFEWGTGPLLDISNNTTEFQVMNSAGTFNTTLTGLETNRTYFFRAKAIGDGTEHGVTLSVMLGIGPTFTASVANITATSAEIQGNVTDFGTYTTVRMKVIWWLPGQTIEEGEDMILPNMTATGPFSAVIEGLAANSTYNYFIKADGGMGTVQTDFQSTFTTLPEYTLTISVTGSGSTIPSAGNHTHSPGAVVNLTATPAAGWQFAGWTGDVVNPGAANTTVVMDADKTVTANFNQIMYTLTILTSGNGTTTPAAGTYSYPGGTVVNITATPNEDWLFNRWSGAATGTENSTEVTMDGAKVVTAHFSMAGTDVTVAAIKADPLAYEGRIVRVSGTYLGWTAGYGNPPVSRSDWVIADETGGIYVTGGLLRLTDPADLGKPIVVTGTVLLKNGNPYIGINKYD